MKIAHIADVHVQDKRRQEYALVFADLYKSLISNAPDIIVVCGDVFDNKMRASPNNLTDVDAFLNSLSNIAPVVLIPGNHDTNCQTPGALDLLTSLLHSHTVPTAAAQRLTYFRSSGVFEAHGIQWTHIATDGHPPTLIDSELFKVCLFHTEVNRTLYPNGHSVSGFSLNQDYFDNFDLALGGHIHKRQIFGSKSNTAYPGSLIQQNVGESHLEHGYLLWTVDLQSKSVSCQPVDIINNYGGFMRIKINERNEDVTQLPLLLRPLYWEIEHTSSPSIHSFTDHYSALFGMKPRAARDVSQPSYIPADDDQLSTSMSHEAIIRKILGKNPLVDDIVALHKQRHTQTTLRGSKIRLLNISFSNMYAFGQDNFIDFTGLEGFLSGVIAPNHSGKSSLIDIILFALYEAHPRTKTKKEIIHKYKSDRYGTHSCSMSIEFELDGKIGRIEKSFTSIKQKSGAGSYRFTYNNVDMTQGGTTETLKAISSVIGNDDAALASSFQLQDNSSSGFVSATETERRKLLTNALSISSFESLERKVVSEVSVLKGKVSILDKQFRGTSFDSLTGQRDNVSSEKNDLDAEITRIEGELAGKRALLSSLQISYGQSISLKTRKTELQRKLSSFGIIDTSEINLSLSEINEQLVSLNNEYVLMCADAASISKKISEKQSWIDRETTERPIEPRAPYDLRDPLPVKSISPIKGNLRPTQADVEWALSVESLTPKIDDSVSSLMMFSDQCECCQSNQKLISGKASVEDVNRARVIIASAVKIINEYNESVVRYGLELTKFTEKSSEVDRLRREISAMKESLPSIDETKRKINSLTDMKNKLDRAEMKRSVQAEFDSIVLIDDSAVSKVNQEIAALESEVRGMRLKRDKVSEEVTRLSGQVDDEKRRSRERSEVGRELDIMSTYRELLTASKGSISYEMLESARGMLTRKINDALIELGAKFSVLIDEDYGLYHGDGSEWLSVGLASGYQKFVLGLASRLALWRMSMSPRVDALVIDEGFGSCDEHYLEEITNAIINLSMSREAPKLVFVVTHVSEMKSKIERLIEIEVREDYSQVRSGIVVSNAPPITSGKAQDAPPIAGGKAQDAPKTSKLSSGASSPDSVKCEACNKFISRKYFKKHLETQLHVKNSSNQQT